MAFKANYKILKKHIAKEFIINFSVSFVFFFFVFFINQILLLIQQILIKNVSPSLMMEIAGLSIPRFLLYTIPFSALSASAMLLGDLSSKNELLAIKAIGISSTKLFSTLILFSILLSFLTYFIADFLLPYSAVRYQNVFSKMITDIPTFELDANSSNEIGDLILSVDQIDDNHLYNILITDEKNNTDFRKTLFSKEAELIVKDRDNYIYELELNDVNLVMTERNTLNSSYIKGDRAHYYLDFSTKIPFLSSIPPSSLSSRDLLYLIEDSYQNKIINDSKYFAKKKELINEIYRLEKEYEKTDIQSLLNEIRNVEETLSLYSSPPNNMFYRYYSSELNKKFALSFASFFLVLVSLPLATLKIKHGRLYGFSISLTLAVVYWYLLFTAQLFIFRINFDTGLLVWIPNLFMLIIAVFMLIIKRKQI